MLYRKEKINFKCQDNTTPLCCLVCLEILHLISVFFLIFYSFLCFRSLTIRKTQFGFPFTSIRHPKPAPSIIPYPYPKTTDFHVNPSKNGEVASSCCRDNGRVNYSLSCSQFLHTGKPHKPGFFWYELFSNVLNCPP